MVVAAAAAEADLARPLGVVVGVATVHPHHMCPLRQQLLQLASALQLQPMASTGPDRGHLPAGRTTAVGTGEPCSQLL